MIFVTINLAIQMIFFITAFVFCIIGFCLFYNKSSLVKLVGFLAVCLNVGCIVLLCNPILQGLFFYG